MNNVDKQYLDLLRDVYENGYEKNTRAGKTRSLFGKTMRFNLREGFPLLTTKKMYFKGVVHELLWFLKGDTNIRYLVENNVHIWDDDAYRFYNEKLASYNDKYIINATDETRRELEEKIYDRQASHMEGWPAGKALVDGKTKEEFFAEQEEEARNYAHSYAWRKEPIKPYSKEEFLRRVKNHDVIILGNEPFFYGDLGPVYGKQWREYGESGYDQIRNIIDTLKNNPDDRRMLCIAFNPDVLSKVALPPCHIMSQFYSRELSEDERTELSKKNNTSMDDTPKRELSCFFYCRSQDLPLGTPYNIASYATLTHIIARSAGMSVGDLVYAGGDCHIYLNQMEGVREQLSRDPEKYDLPELEINPDKKDVDEIEFDDIKLVGYESYPTIKFPLSVG